MKTKTSETIAMIDRQVERPIDTTELTFVIQGGISIDSRPQVDATIQRLRKLAPGCQIVISTNGAATIENIDANQCVIGKDAGALPNLKRAGFPNNINRQIQSTRDGLALVTTPYAVKLRSDCSLHSLRFLEAYVDGSQHSADERIVFCSRFTIDPNLFEQMPYHLSDWFQFGSTAALQKYWSCPFMELEESQYYLSHPYARHSNFFDRLFNSRFAVEQHIGVNYARALGYRVPAFHNDISSPVLHDFNRFLAERCIVMEGSQIGLEFDKYAWAFHSEFQDLNCISQLDWQIIRNRHYGIAVTDEASGRIQARRQLRKRLTRRLFRLTQPVGAVLYVRPLRVLVNRMLRLIAA